MSMVGEDSGLEGRGNWWDTFVNRRGLIGLGERGWDWDLALR